MRIQGCQQLEGQIVLPAAHAMGGDILKRVYDQMTPFTADAIKQTTMQ